MVKICKNGKPWGFNNSYNSPEYKEKLSVQKRGNKNPFYKNGQKKKYRMKMYEGKRIYEHRLIMQQTLGRELLSSEFVHHKDGNTLNNSLENLELISDGRSAHAKLHSNNRSLGL